MSHHIAIASDWPFNNPANWGGTGLMEIPTARVLDDGELRFGVSQALPYRWYTVGMGVFPGLEFSGRYTQITNIQTKLPNFGSNKDKAFDIKYQILSESKWFPAFAIGIHDFWGTRLFPSEYLVLSRQLYPFDFTFGIATKRLKGPISYSSDIKIPIVDELEFGLFGGIEYAFNSRLNLITEFNPIEYEIDKRSGRGVPEGARSPFNIGLRFNILKGMQLGLSYQRGDTLGLSFHIQSELGTPVLPQKADPPLHMPINRKTFKESNPQAIIKQIHEAIHTAGFNKVAVYTKGKEVVAEFQNGKYLSDEKALGRVLRILLFHSPVDTHRLTAIMKNRDIPIISASVAPDHFNQYLLGRVSDDTFLKLIEIDLSNNKIDSNKYSSIKDNKKFDYKLNVKPDIDFYLNDPSGPFKFKTGIQPYVTINPWKGGTGTARYDIPFYSDISSSNNPPSSVVRSDSWKYLGRDYSFNRLMFDQAFKFSKRIFGRFSVGYFESMYAGIGGELLTFLGDGRFAFGIESDWVWKREPGTQLALLDHEFHTFLGNLYYSIPGPNISLHLKYGKYMEGDVGWVIDVSREYDTGAIIGGWWSFTGTDVFTDPYNRGYNDKGVYISIPIRMFLNRDSKQRYSYAIAPWTRDVAASPSHWKNLMSLGKELMPYNFKENIKEIKE